MAITRTYAVGEESVIRRLDNHTGPWVDVSIPFGPGFTAGAFYDVMADPSNPDKVVVVGQNNGGPTGIMVSNDAGVTWVKPGGSWTAATVIHEVWFASSTVIWVVGSDGYVSLSTDGGLTFNLTPARPQGGAFPFTTCIHALDDKVAVVAGSLTNGAAENNVLVYKTIDGGASWTTLNGGSALVNALGVGGVTGPAGGIFISTDQQEIIVSTGYTQQRTTNGGFLLGDFADILPEMNQSGKHLTWYPSLAPTHFRHTGGIAIHVNESTDGGATWATTRSGEAITMIGAHFYSNNNGYYIVGNSTYLTTDGGKTGVISDTVPLPLYAVWTMEEPTIYCLEDCLDEVAPIYSPEIFLGPFVGQIVRATVAGYPADICWTVSVFTGEPTEISITDVDSVDASFADCADCVPPPPNDKCWDLISCNGECDDILGVSGFDFDPFLNQLVYVNGDTDCIYEVRALRQAFFLNLLTAPLSNPAGAFQLGTDNHTFQINSLVINNVENIVGTPPSYTLTPGVYQPLQCTGLTCVPVLPNTTENSFDNIPLFLNNVFTSLGLDLEAFPSDPTLCPFTDVSPAEFFRVQYRDGDTFSITFSITNNAGTVVWVLSVNAGNITIHSEYQPDTDYETCNSNVFCEPLPSPPVFTSVDPWNLPCPIVVEPEVGEACDVKIRIGEPGFSVKNCDPDEVIAVKTKFAESVYALYKRMRLGIETCCEFDLDRIDIKNQLIDLGAIYDPDLCVEGQVVPNACCLQPCEAIAELIIPLAISCPAPIDPSAVLVTGAPIPLACNPPEDADALVTIV